MKQDHMGCLPMDKKEGEQEMLCCWCETHHSQNCWMKPNLGHIIFILCFSIAWKIEVFLLL